MEVNLSPDKEARLLEFASRTGKDAAQVVEEGRASARRGDLLEHEEVVRRVEQTLRS
jgi:predicted transcriptional regulator